MNLERLTLIAALLLGATIRAGDAEESLKRWLENTVWHHGYTEKEVLKATGISRTELRRRKIEWNIFSETRPVRSPDSPVLVLPFPGGHHPRVGFLDGAINPDRGTKASIFLPWEGGGYIVVDLPEAVFSGRDLIFLAHTHIDTVWDKQGIKIPHGEWTVKADGKLEMVKALPNGVKIGSRIETKGDEVHFTLWLENGSPKPVTDLRAQVCILLKGAPDFDALTNDNKVLGERTASVRSPDGRRWMSTTWDLVHRPWANPPCPCLHVDPRLPDCAPGQRVSAKGRLWFGPPR